MQHSIAFRGDCSMRRSTLGFGLLALALSACATPQQANGCSDCIAIGEKQEAAPDLVVRPLAVIEDSRCPIDVQCVWQGRVVVEAELELPGEVTRVTLESDKPFHINAGLLSITEIAPHQTTERSPIEPANYRFAFRFVRDLDDGTAPEAPEE